MEELKFKSCNVRVIKTPEGQQIQCLTGKSNCRKWFGKGQFSRGCFK